LEYLTDLECDFWVLAGVRDPYTELSGPQYFQMAYRFVAYKGVMRLRAEAEAEEQRPKQPGEEKYSSRQKSEEEIRAENYAARFGAAGRPGVKSTKGAALFEHSTVKKGASNG
jgi:hypothetical protein